jgi:hypothetical protein
MNVKPGMLNLTTFSMLVVSRNPFKWHNRRADKLCMWNALYVDGWFETGSAPPNRVMNVCVCVCVCVCACVFVVVLSRPIHRCCHCHSEAGQPYRQKCVFQSQDDRATPVLRASQQRCHRCRRLCQRVWFVKNPFFCVRWAARLPAVELTSVSLVYQQAAFTKRSRFRVCLGHG